ncbi:hypothetical protein C2G38_2229072 [Gigaspora rosea]|uniref:Uncharacterized protein n=1 Tax=Gigaspora rosea TaxID=44941 RepID=A0A397U4N6_9GLOM|nr:hypothetical protein C2G38_2229072 [Gigaspora rosea]
MLPGPINAFLKPLCTELTTMSTNSERLPLKGLQPVPNLWSCPLKKLYHPADQTLYIKRYGILQMVLISSSEGDYVLTPEDLLRCLKIRSKKFPYILPSDIEWTYVFNNSLPSSTTTNAKGISEVEFDKDLDDKEDAALISEDEPTELVQVRIQDATPVIKEKHRKNLCSAKK